MDSLTQLTFGAACGEAILGRKIGNKALYWGAAIGTLPDLDILIPLGSPVNNFVYHRGFSHSMIVLTLLAPLMAWLLVKIHPATKKYYREWVVFCFVVLQASVILDLMTIYGTQIFWPIDKTPMAIPVLFIIDPTFTLPVLSGTLAALLLKRHRALGHRLNTIGLCLSLAYLAWAHTAAGIVEQKVTQKLARQDISYSQLVCSPAPFTTLLWRVVGIENGQYFETFYSIFDDDSPLFVDVYPRNLDLLNGIESHPPVAKLRHFTRGYYALSAKGDSVVMTDLRMGWEPDYVFRFKVARLNNTRAVPMDDEVVISPRNIKHLVWIWDRIWTPLPRF